MRGKVELGTVKQAYKQLDRSDYFKQWVGASTVHICKTNKFQENSEGLLARLKSLKVLQIVEIDAREMTTTECKKFKDTLYGFVITLRLKSKGGQGIAIIEDLWFGPRCKLLAVQTTM